MPSITVKRIPDEPCERFKQGAAEHRRSINKEVIIEMRKLKQECYCKAMSIKQTRGGS